MFRITTSFSCAVIKKFTLFKKAAKKELTICPKTLYILIYLQLKYWPIRSVSYFFASSLLNLGCLANRIILDLMSADPLAYKISTETRANKFS